jgi:hypothetical protein
MPEDKPYLPPELLPQKPATQPQPPSDFHFEEEFGTAKKNFPPWKIVAICLGVVVVVVAIVTLMQRPKPSATGSIDDVTAVDIPGQNSVLVAITLSFKNNGEKGFWIHSMKADLSAQNQDFHDEAAAASDFDRYSQAFPTLKEHAQKPFKIGDEIAPGTKGSGTFVVSFPVKLDDFNNRKSLTVTIWPDDQPLPLVLKK